MVADNEAISLSTVHSCYFMFNLPPSVCQGKLCSPCPKCHIAHSDLTALNAVSLIDAVS